MDKFRSRFPRYPDDSDYKTNASSYYEDLARKQKLFEVLTNQMIDLAKDTTLTIEEFSNRLDGIKEEMKTFFAEWLIDGTLAEVINERVFTDINNRLGQVDDEVKKARMNVLGNTFPSLKERLDGYEQTTTKKIADVERQIGLTNDVVQTKRKQLSNILYVSDFKKQPNETDDELINRVLDTLPRGEGTVVLDGIKYSIKNPITIGRYQSLKGAGHATILECNVNARNIIQVETDPEFDYAYGITIEDLQLIGNYNNWGIDLKKSTHVLIKNVYIYNVEWGVYATSVWLGHYDRVTIRNYDVKMGESGFNIGGGTSNVYTNTWVKNFRKGYLSASIYTSFNGTACDTFTEYAYHLSQNTVLNGCGAEDGRLVENGYVFGAGARGVTFNSCEVMNIEYQGIQDKAFMFRFNGTQATINSFRIHGTYQATKMAFMYLNGASAIKVNGYEFRQPFTTQHVFEGTASTVVEDTRTSLISYRHNGQKSHLEY